MSQDSPSRWPCTSPAMCSRATGVRLSSSTTRPARRRKPGPSKVYTGKAGGPIADLVKLVGEVVDVRRAPIGFTVVKGKGTFTVGEIVRAELEPFLGPTRQPTTLTESIFSTVPGSPAYVGKASIYRQKSPELKQDINLQGHNAILSDFKFEHADAAAA